MGIRTANSKMSCTLSRLAVLTAAAFITAGSSPCEVKPPATDLQNLEQQVGDFLERWLTKKDPAGATKKHLSTKIDNFPSLMPRDTQSRMERFLSRIFESGEGVRYIDDAPVFEPLSRNTDAGLVNLLKKRNIPIKAFRNTPFGYFPVNKWDDISWSASGVPEHHYISPAFFQSQDIKSMYGVVGRIKLGPDSEASVLTLMLWVNETQASKDKRRWKLWGVIPVPTH